MPTRDAYEEPCMPIDGTDATKPLQYGEPAHDGEGNGTGSPKYENPHSQRAVNLPLGARVVPAERMFKIRTLKDALSEKETAPPWVIQDLLLRDSATLVSAHPHSMKSLSLLAACIESVAKKQVWGHFAAPTVKKSVFIETEDPRWMVDARIRGFSTGLGLNEELPGFEYCCQGPFDLVKAKMAIRAFLQEHKPDFAVLSTLQGLLGGRDWLRQDQMAEINALFVDLAKHVCPIIVITHSPWDRRDKRAAGTVQDDVLWGNVTMNNSTSP